MSAQHLRSFLSTTQPEQLANWLVCLRIVASLYIERQRKHKWGSLSDGIEPREVVNETINRVLSSRVKYVWDEVEDFDDFITECVHRTVEFYYSSIRRNVGRSVDLDASLVELDSRFSTPPAQLDAVEYGQFSEELSSVLSPNVTGQRRTYAEMLPSLAMEDKSSEEIAKMLDVKLTTLKEYRKRLWWDLKRRDKS